LQYALANPAIEDSLLSGMTSTLLYIVDVALSMGTAPAKRDLAVAIYGGGPSSATLTNAIKDYEHIDLQYFDPAQNPTPTSYRLYGLTLSVPQCASSA
jgi:salicylate hydroxylase